MMLSVTYTLESEIDEDLFDIAFNGISMNGQKGNFTTIKKTGSISWVSLLLC